MKQKHKKKMCRYKIIGTDKNGETWTADEGYSDPYDASVNAEHWTKISTDGSTFSVVDDDGF